MRRFHTHPDKANEVMHVSLTALLVAAGALLFEWYRADGRISWVAITVPGVILVVALYAFLRARLVERLPVVEITDTHLRWRVPGRAFFSSVPLADLVASEWSADQLLLIDRRGHYHRVPLKDLHFREGSFAVSSLRVQLDQLVARGAGGYLNGKVS